MKIEIFANDAISDHDVATIEDEIMKRPLFFNVSYSPATPLYWFVDFECRGRWVESLGYGRGTLFVRANLTSYTTAETWLNR